MSPKFTLLTLLLSLCIGTSLPSAYAISGPQQVRQEIVGKPALAKAVTKKSTRQQKRIQRKIDRFQKRIGNASNSINRITLVGIITLIVGLILIGAAGGIIGLITGIIGLALAIVGLVLVILGVLAG